MVVGVCDRGGFHLIADRKQSGAAHLKVARKQTLAFSFFLFIPSGPQPTGCCHQNIQDRSSPLVNPLEKPSQTHLEDVLSNPFRQFSIQSN
jgi:hypothetical protein